MIALLRTEWTKAVWRTRTAIVAAGMIGLPILITFAVHARGGGRRRQEAEGLFRLARLSGILMPPAVLAAMSGFLLVVVAGMLVGDSVAGDAAWGNLRYLLIRPVSRVRLLVAKAIVAMSLVWLFTLLVTLAALIAGAVLFGWHAVTLPSLGVHLSTTALLVRVGVANGYVACGYFALLGMGLLFSTMTNSPAGAIGATVAVYIVSQILNGIEAFGSLRNGLPTHYLEAWQPIFTRNVAT
jgi:ABC-2 type transport system permease protein